MSHLSRGREFPGLSVSPRPNEDPERLIKRFMRQVRLSRVMDELRRRESYQSPGERRRRKRNSARHRAVKERDGK